MRQGWYFDIYLWIFMNVQHLSFRKCWHLSESHFIFFTPLFIFLGRVTNLKSRLYKGKNVLVRYWLLNRSSPMYTSIWSSLQLLPKDIDGILHSCITLAWISCQWLSKRNRKWSPYFIFDDYIGRNTCFVFWGSKNHVLCVAQISNFTCSEQ